MCPAIRRGRSHFGTGRRAPSFSGDAIYDGDLLDNLYHSDAAIYRQTLERLSTLDADTFHAGHFPSFGKARLQAIVADYIRGAKTLGNVMDWYNDLRARSSDIYADQDWSRLARD